MYLAGKPTHTQELLAVHDKYSGEEVFRVCKADAANVEQAIAAAAQTAPTMRGLSPVSRQQILRHIHERLTHRLEEFASVICTEAGKPIKDARTEVLRAIDTFAFAAHEAVYERIHRVALNAVARGKGYEGLVKRVPIGPCSFITPFNFPLNLVAHKVAPAIAVGCPFVLKPAPQTPVTAILLAEILAEAHLPAGAFSVLPCDIEVAAPLILDERIKLLSFTGSSTVGWSLKSRAGKKKVVLELGGNAACIVDETADVDAAIPRIVLGAFAQSGQSCISVQRLFVHTSRIEEVRERLVADATALRYGDPHLESTFFGPLISPEDAARVHEWVQEAVRTGGHLLCGGHRVGRAGYEATIIENSPETCRLWTEEVFGPVLSLHSFVSFESACEAVNRSRYGLQAGVFTANPSHIEYAWNELEVGGVIINDVPTLRFDNMPYGGVKDSGCGREGVRDAMLEMSEQRLKVVKNS